MKMILFFNLIYRKEKENTICYSIIDPTHKEGLFFYKRKYIEIIISSIKYNVINGYKCILLSFCENEGDLNVCTEIYKYLPNDISKQVSILNYNGNIFEMLEIISSSKEIISSRFHANILGIISETPIIPFIYSDKTLNVLKDINYNGNIYKIKECDQLSMQNPFNELNQSCDQVKNIEVIKQSSKKQFLEFEKWLKKEKS